MYCRKCGREIPDDSVMCGYCGTPTNPDNPYTYGGTPQNMDEGAWNCFNDPWDCCHSAGMLCRRKMADILCRCGRPDSWNYRITEAKVRKQQRDGTCRGDLQCDRASYENYCDYFIGGRNRELPVFPYVSLLKVPF
mgnify:CR=1 FL=1